MTNEKQDKDGLKVMDKGATSTISAVPTGWKVELDLKPIPNRNHDWNWCHEFHDGDPFLSGTAASRDDALQCIEEIMETWRENGGVL
jgi:hypothetical protein|tara:strand:+ start:4223 stop:4483 length:261 start_codon:yes stop_codon:yes gene_type:complete